MPVAIPFITFRGELIFDLCKFHGQDLLKYTMKMPFMATLRSLTILSIVEKRATILYYCLNILPLLFEGIFDLLEIVLLVFIAGLIRMSTKSRVPLSPEIRITSCFLFIFQGWSMISKLDKS